MASRQPAVGVLTIAVLVAAGGWWLAAHRNPREVLPGRFYRSPQLKPEKLRAVLETLDVKTVVNLRGSGSGKVWYQEERAVCGDLGVAHRTVTFDMDDWPPRRRVIELLAVLDGTDGPVLVHCLRGVDRSGWAAAVAILAYGGPLDAAMAQLSGAMGHFCRREECPQHRFFAAYEEYLRRQALTGGAAVFRTWVNEVYCPPEYDAGIEWVREPPTVLLAGAEFEMALRVRNHGTSAWAIGPDSVRLGARIAGPFSESPDQAEEIFLSRISEATDLGRSLEGPVVLSPGEGHVFRITVRAPVVPGLYVLQLDMVKEAVHWFSDMGWIGRVRTLRVGSLPATPKTERDIMVTPQI